MKHKLLLLFAAAVVVGIVAVALPLLQSVARKSTQTQQETLSRTGKTAQTDRRICMTTTGAQKDKVFPSIAISATHTRTHADNTHVMCAIEFKV